MLQIRWATRGMHWLRQRAATPKGEANPLTLTLFESRIAIHPREGEIPSNCTLATCSEYVPAPCTHCLSTHPSRVWMRILMKNSNLSSVRRGKSTQGIRRGTCGWITSLKFYNFSLTYYTHCENSGHFERIADAMHHGPVAHRPKKSGRF